MIELTLALLKLMATCTADKAPPAPDYVLLYSNTISVVNLFDPCGVKFVKIIAKGKGFEVETQGKGNHWSGALTFPPKTPVTIMITYADNANNTGSLSWTISFLPYTTHTLAWKTITGNQAIFLVGPPPNKPLLPRQWSDPNFQSGVVLLLMIVSLAYWFGKKLYGLVIHKVGKAQEQQKG